MGPSRRRVTRAVQRCGTIPDAEAKKGDRSAMAVEQPSPVKEAEPVEEPFVTQHDRQQVQRSTQQTRDDCLRQLEFYLCDINLPYDAFLKGEMGADGSLACETVAE